MKYFSGRIDTRFVENVLSIIKRIKSLYLFKDKISVEVTIKNKMVKKEIKYPLKYIFEDIKDRIITPKKSTKNSRVVQD